MNVVARVCYELLSVVVREIVESKRLHDLNTEEGEMEMLLPKFDRDAYLDAKHLANIRLLASCVSGMTPCEAHHLRWSAERGIGMKATDRWAVPLTMEEHRELHATTSAKYEELWFLDRGVACYALASQLWFRRGDLAAMRLALDKHLIRARL